MRGRIEVQSGALILAAAGLLFLPVDWFLASIISAAVHEMGHLLVLRCLKQPCLNIRIGVAGAVIETGTLTPFQELLTAAAGPFFSFLPVLFWRWFPRMAVLALMQGLFNLLPVYPMDGGRILRVILIRFFPEQEDLIMKTAALLFGGILCIGCIRHQMPVWLIAASFLFLIRRLLEKFLAKMHGNDYNGSD